MPREVWVVSLVGFIVTLGFGVVGPSLPALGAEFGVGTTLMSLAISGFAGARLVANLGFTRVLERLRLRTVLWVGLLWQAVCIVFAGLSPEYLGFIVLRSVSGLGSAAFTIASSALLLVLVPAGVRGRAMSIYAGSTALGTVSGPALGGLLAVVEPRLPLVAYGCALGVASLATVLLLRSARDVKAAPRSVLPESGVVGSRRSALRMILADRLFIAALTCQVVGGWVFYGMRTTTIPLHLASLGYALGVIGILLSIASIAQIVASAASGSLSDRIGRIIPIGIGLVCAALAVSGLLFAEVFTIALIAFVLLGLAGGAVASTGTALLGDSRNGQTGFGIGAYWVASDSAAILGPLVSGVLAESLGFDAAYIVAIVWVLVALVFVLRARGAGGRSRQRTIEPLPPAVPDRPELG